MDKVAKFYPRDAAQNPDMVLEQAVGIYTEVMIIGYDKDEQLNVRMSTNWSDSDALYAIEQFKHGLFAGAYDAEDEGA